MTSGRRCAACKCLRRKCPPNCIFSPYFPSNNPQRFACVHRIYGAKNVAKMLQGLPADLRGGAADSMHFEAQHRMEDPVYGCVRIISQLHQEIRNAETQLAKTRAEIAIITSSNTNIIQNHPNIDHHNDDHDALQVLESDLNQLNLRGQISNNNIVVPSQLIGPSTQAPSMVSLEFS